MKNKRLFVVILVLFFVFLGGALTVFVGMFGDFSGDRLYLPAEEHEECSFNLSTGVVPASEDPNGVGYEFFACSDCGELRKLTANHESGHYFRTFSNGEKYCACGAELLFGDVTVVTKHEFSSTEGEDIFINALANNVLENGKFVVSLVNGQRAVLTEINGVSKNFTMSALMSGAYNGLSYDFVSFSFELCYTGDATKITGGNFFNWRSFCQDGGRYYDDITMNLKPTSDGKLIVDDVYVLEDGVSYIFTAYLSPITNEIYFTMNGGKYVDVLLCSGIAAYKVTDFWAAYFGRDKFYCSDTSQFALYIDNIKAGYLDEIVNQSMVNVDTQCDHDFIVKGIVDYDHPAAEAWKKYTCKDCKRWYYGH